MQNTNSQLERVIVMQIALKSSKTILRSREILQISLRVLIL